MTQIDPTSKAKNNTTLKPLTPEKQALQKQQQLQRQVEMQKRNQEKIQTLIQGELKKYNSTDSLKNADNHRDIEKMHQETIEQLEKYQAELDSLTKEKNLKEISPDYFK